MSSPKRRILIVKTGFSEFLDLGISTTVSLGDVLICTALLHLYSKDDVTWVTDWQAKQLLENNPLIRRLLIFGTPAMDTLAAETFDVLVNLEKDSGICVFLNRVKAGKKYGFFFNDRTYRIEPRQRSAQYLLAGQENHGDIRKNALEILYETVGQKWRGQGLILPPRRAPKIKHDIGFNHSVGTKWPTKAWPMDHWKSLEKIFSGKRSVSWQQGHKNLTKYIDWINSCRVIVTSDSLGQAIGQALGKRVVTLYGPTNPLRMKGIPNVTVVPSTLKCPLMPCYMPVCGFDKFCMDYISPERVANVCEGLLK